MKERYTGYFKVRGVAKKALKSIGDNPELHTDRPTLNFIRYAAKPYLAKCFFFYKLSQVFKCFWNIYGAQIKCWNKFHNIVIPSITTN